MNATELLPMLDPATTALLGWTLMHFLWQGLLIGIGAAIVLRLLREASAQARYLSAGIALSACALMPILTFITLQDAAQTPLLLGIVNDVPTRSALEEQLTVGSWWDIPRTQLQILMPVFVSLWAGIATLLMVRLAGGLLWVQRLKDDADAPLPAALQRRADDLARRLGLRRDVPLRVANFGESPLAAGVFKPMVLVPAALLLRLPTDALEALIAHELAHVRRHDYLFNLMQGAVEAALFYHPVVWWLSRRLREERELIADDLAAEALGDRRRLALALSELDALQLPHTIYAPAAQGGQLMSRIQHLLHPRPAVIARSSMALPLIAVAGIGLAVYAFASEPQSRPLDGVVGGIVSRSTTAKSSSSTTPSGTIAVVPAKGDRIMISGELDDIDDIRRARSGETADFIWFRHDGHEYAVRDAALVADVKALWAVPERHEQGMGVLQDRMQEHEARVEALSQRFEELSELAGDDHRIEQAVERLSVLAEQRADIAQQQSEAMAEIHQAQGDDERRALDAHMAKLQRSMSALQSQMATQQRLVQTRTQEQQSRLEPLEAMSLEMQEATRPMEAIGDEMEALGKLIEADAARAEAQTRRLLERAMSEGKAQRID